MKRFLACIILLTTAATLLPAQVEIPDRSDAPYFFVQSDNPTRDALPLKSTKAEVNIAGVIADVVITQTYSNEGTRPLEAIYRFPGSTRAAVYGMQMRIGDRTITAEIREREQARQEYETAKSEGKRASLLEQDRPNVFQMNVANIMPGDIVEVELRYTELLVPEDGIYAFAYPAVVGPRYTGESTTSDSYSDHSANPHLPAGEDMPYEYDLTVNINAGLPIQEVSSHTHQIDLVFPEASAAEIRLPDPAQQQAGNRDFILEYRLAGNQIESGLLLYEHGDENFFLLMMQPPQRVEADDIPPREYVFVVDVSGSMNGFPLDVAKNLLRNLLTGLRPDDRFNIMLFAGGSQVLAPESLPVNEANMNRGLRFLTNAHGGGGTNLLSALNRALDLPRCREDISRSFVVVTDGYVNVEKETFDLIRAKLDEANLFAFGIGGSVNRYIIEGMARVGQSEPLIVTSQEEAGDKADAFRQYISAPVLTRVAVKYNGFETYEQMPPAVPDVLAERPVIVFGKYRGEPGGTIKVTGYTGEGRYRKSFAVADAQPNVRNAALRYLWAREQIRLLDDYSQVTYDNSSEAVTALGLKYNLMTAYTSFVAIDDVPVAAGETAETSVQPLPMPAGVSNMAIGFDLGLEGVSHLPAPQDGMSVCRISVGKVEGYLPLTDLARIKARLIEHCTGLEASGILPAGDYRLEIHLDRRSGTLIKLAVPQHDLSEEIRRQLEQALQGKIFWSAGGNGRMILVVNISVQ